MSEKEISFNVELDTWEPCGTCLDVIFDAAYSQGFLTEDDEFVLIDDIEDPIPSYTPSPISEGYDG